MFAKSFSPRRRRGKQREKGEIKKEKR